MTIFNEVSTLIIGGTAAYHLDFAQHTEVLDEQVIETPFGPAGPLRFFRTGGSVCAFLSRHGGEGRLGLTPPFIPYQANVWAARVIGARRILSWNSAGSLVRSLQPGSLACVADLIDWTRRRRTTFGPGVAERTPYAAQRPLFDPALRLGLARAAAATGRPVSAAAVYVGTEGARLETAAEIALLAQGGAELVGMTLSPEGFLAAELGLPYASLCWVSNYATGVPFDGTEQRLFGPEVGPLLFSIVLAFLKAEGTHGN
jgi:5'-methylthioadenosine phosphorylase